MVSNLFRLVLLGLFSLAVEGNNRYEIFFSYTMNEQDEDCWGQEAAIRDIVTFPALEEQDELTEVRGRAWRVRTNNGRGNNNRRGLRVRVLNNSNRDVKELEESIRESAQKLITEMSDEDKERVPCLKTDAMPENSNNDESQVPLVFVVMSPVESNGQGNGGDSNPGQGNGGDNPGQSNGLGNGNNRRVEEADVLETSPEGVEGRRLGDKECLDDAKKYCRAGIYYYCDFCCDC
ncbi:expressed unknown protein [Seminavis robusta]|uniref:Uncharacterized protein n=1 Tax=Seminavis robusta TaxID=568900 RepID=A0A9N8ENT5_9STRA|nr:expressed unknown protein [Seminavis robusta]|eukprot:Sro1301_g260820.1 n/a (234) ;mRNA; r:18748-19449